MKNSLLCLALVLSLGLISSGCKKKEEAANDSPAAETTQKTATAEGEDPSGSSRSLSLANKNSAEQSAPSDAMGLPDNPTADSALKLTNAGEYEKAAVVLMVMQRAGQLHTEQDGAAYQSAMRNLQTKLANAASNGDPKAKAAIAVLRSSLPR